MRMVRCIPEEEMVIPPLRQFDDGTRLRVRADRRGVA